MDKGEPLEATASRGSLTPHVVTCPPVSLAFSVQQLQRVVAVIDEVQTGAARNYS